MPYRIHLWRYTINQRNYPGYHLTADSLGGSTLKAALVTHQHAAQLVRTFFTLTPPTPKILDIPANHAGNSTVVALAELELVTDPRFPAAHMAFEERRNHCRVELSTALAGAVWAGVDDLLRGGGDYSVGGSGNEVLWFWWYPTR